MKYFCSHLNVYKIVPALSERKSVLIAACLLVFFAVGCGGGTSGTSAGGELRMLGSAASASGLPLANASMAVYSGDQILETAASDASGDFEMALPDKPALIIELGGAKTSSFTRAFDGSSILSTVVQEKQAGGVDFGPSLEVKIDSSNLCTSLQQIDNSLEIVGPPPSQENCNVVFDTFASNFSGQVRAQVISTCSGVLQVIAAATASENGVVVLDVAEALRNNCKNTEITLFADQNTVRPIVININ